MVEESLQSGRAHAVGPAGEPTRPLLGVNPVAVLEAIKARALRRRAGRSVEADGRRIGLVVEGGGMRGVFSAGGLVALAHLGLTGVFDEVYATSSGALNASYFLSKQPRRGITVYYQDMVKRRAISFLRPWRIIDIDWIVDRIVTGEKALDANAIISSPTKLFVNLLDASTGEEWLVDTQATRAPLITVLKAATAIPVAYNKVIAVEGRSCIDAGVASPFPLKEALSRGCTDLLVLLTRPGSFRGARPARPGNWLFRLLCARGNRALLRAYMDQPNRDGELRALALGRATIPTGVNVATFCPDDGERIGRLTTNPAVLHAAALRSGRRLLDAMGAETDGWTLPALRESRHAGSLRGHGASGIANMSRPDDQ